MIGANDDDHSREGVKGMNKPVKPGDIVDFNQYRKEIGALMKRASSGRQEVNNVVQSIANDPNSTHHNKSEGIFSI